MEVELAVGTFPNLQKYRYKGRWTVDRLEWMVNALFVLC